MKYTLVVNSLQMKYLYVLKNISFATYLSVSFYCGSYAPWGTPYLLPTTSIPICNLRKMSFWHSTTSVWYGGGYDMVKMKTIALIKAYMKNVYNKVKIIINYHSSPNKIRATIENFLIKLEKT